MRVFVLRLCIKFQDRIGPSVRKIWRTSGLSISVSGDLDLWPWNWCASLSVRWSTVIPIWCISRTFPSPHFGQHMSEASRDLATLIFDLGVGGHGACQWCGSSSSVYVPSLKFVGFPVRKILLIYCVSINRPGFAQSRLSYWRRYQHQFYESSILVAFNNGTSVSRTSVTCDNDKPQET